MTAVRRTSKAGPALLPCRKNPQGKKMRPQSDAATDGDRLGRLIGDGGPDQTQVQPKPEVLRAGDRRGYPQALAVDQKILR